jgi:vacuolar-type H+-ATPase subunit H
MRRFLTVSCIALCVGLITLPACSSLENIDDRIEREAEERVDRNIDDAIEKGADETEEAIKEGAKGDQEQDDEDQEGGGSGS